MPTIWPKSINENAAFSISLLKNVYLLKNTPSIQILLQFYHQPMSIKFLNTEEDYQQALEQLSVLFDAKICTSESDEADLLALLVDEYEKKHYPNR